MSTKCFAQVRGHVIRVTRLNSAGLPQAGNSVVAVSKRISQITVDEVSEDGTNIRDRNFGDELCVVDDSYASLIVYTVETTFCGVDPDVLSIFTNQPVVRDYKGDVVGFDANTGINLDDFGFSLEVWSRIAGGTPDSFGNRPFGYTVFPFLKGGRLGGFSFENGAVQFQVMGAQTRDGNSWGTGPHESMLRADGSPAPMPAALATNTHYRNILTYLKPPAASCGAFSLASA